MLKIKIETPHGTLITEFYALYWRQTAKLSRTGSFECQAPLSLPDVSLVTHFCRLFAFWRGKQIGSGIIEVIDKNTDSGIVSWSGSDLSRELAWVLLNGAMYNDEHVVPEVGYLRTYDDEILWSWWLGNEGSTAELDNTNTYLYIGTPKKCNAISFLLGVSNSSDNDKIGYGYSRHGGWKEYKLREDETKALFQSGTVRLLGRPTDHVKHVIEGRDLYWIRLDPKNELSVGDQGGPIEFLNITSIVRNPILNDLAVLFSHTQEYGRAWTVSKVGTELGSLTFYEYKSLLNIIVALAIERGEQWRLGDGRHIEWLGKIELGESYDFIAMGDSGRAFSIGDLKDNELIIKSINEKTDAQNLVTRIYPVSAGNATLTITLSDATLTIPPGYEINRDENYIRHVLLEEQFGIIASKEEFRSTGGIDGVGGDEFTSNVLAEMCLAKLSSDIRRDITLTALAKHRPAIGSVVKIDYFSKNLIVKGNYFLVELDTTIGQTGALYTLECSNLPSVPNSDEEFEIKKILESEDARSFPQAVYGSYVIEEEQELPILGRGRIDRGGIDKDGIDYLIDGIDDGQQGKLFN